MSHHRKLVFLFWDKLLRHYLIYGLVKEMYDIRTAHLASHGCKIEENVKAIRLNIEKRKFVALLSYPHPPFRRPSCTLPLMLSPKNTGTLSFLSMTHTSTVKLWVCMDFVKDTWEKALRLEHSSSMSNNLFPIFAFNFHYAPQFSSVSLAIKEKCRLWVLWTAPFLNSIHFLSILKML